MNTPDQANPDARLWPAVWKLLRLRLVIFLSGFRRATIRRKVITVAFILIIALVVVSVFAMSWGLLRLLQMPQVTQAMGDVNVLLESVPVMVLGGAFLAILLTSFGVLLQALYLAGDMDFLLTAPLPIRAVFVAKLLQAILPNFSLICLFSLPVLIGLGASQGYNPLYYPLVVVMLAALALAAAGLSSLLVMLVVRVLPARRVAEVLGFLGAIISIILSQSGNLMNTYGREVSADQAENLLRLANRFNAPWSPIAWAGRGLVGIGKGEWLAGSGLVILSLGLAALIFMVALTTAERLYYTGWASMQGVQRKKKVVRAARPTARNGLVLSIQRLIPSPIRAIVLKDFYVLRRDLRNMSQLVTPLIFGIIYAVLLLRQGGQPPAGRGEAPLWFMMILSNAWVYGNVGLSLFVGWMLQARLAGMAFSQEGRKYWLLKTAPVSAEQLLAAKFIVAYLPTLGLSGLFLIVISILQRAAWQTFLFTLPALALVIAGNAGLNLAFGVLGANMDWEDPRQMQRGGSGCLGALASMIYLPVSLLLIFGPPLLLPLVGAPSPAGELAGLLLGGVFSLVCAILTPWLVRRRVEALGESG